MTRFSVVLLDLSGVVFVGGDAIPGAVAAVARLRKAGLAVRFLTNTTRQPLRSLVGTLRRLGVADDPAEVFTPAVAARRRLAAQGATPHLLVHPDLVEDFAGLPEGGRKVVVVGDAGAAFDYASLNEAFRLIADGADFLALARNRTFKDTDGALSLDAGPFVAALEFASRREARVLGKPDAAFFAAAYADTGASADAVVMIGDDAESDVGGAMAAGLAGLLVRTGKYRAGDEDALAEPPTAVCDDLAAAVDALLSEGGF